jgi:hypothetical protein
MEKHYQVISKEYLEQLNQKIVENTERAYNIFIAKVNFSISRPEKLLSIEQDLEKARTVALNSIEKFKSQLSPKRLETEKKRLENVSIFTSVFFLYLFGMDDLQKYKKTRHFIVMLKLRYRRSFFYVFLTGNSNRYLNKQRQCKSQFVYILLIVHKNLIFLIEKKLLA